MAITAQDRFHWHKLRDWETDEFIDNLPWVHFESSDRCPLFQFLRLGLFFLQNFYGPMFFYALLRVQLFH